MELRKTFFVVDDDRIAVLPEGMSLDYGAMIDRWQWLRMQLCVAGT